MNRSGAHRVPLSVVGLELEYAIVDADLRPACVVAQAFRAAAGRHAAHVERGAVGFSNELAAHVLECKTVVPHADLARVERYLVRALRTFAASLRSDFGARLLPTGMHPLMRPADTALWQGVGRGIYDSYARVFDVNGHGWLNIQSNHVNLPFGRTSEDIVDLHNAVACILPYLPALAASSPLIEGRLGPHLDNRLAFYRDNQRRIAAITGEVVPEYLTSVGDYRRHVLAPIYQRLRRIPGGDRLCREWVNSRGAILRFDRRALEIRILDLQECVAMDVAIAAFVRAVLRWAMRALRARELGLPAHAMLVADFDAVVTQGRAASVCALHVEHGARRRARRAGDVLETLLQRAREHARVSERRYLDLVEWRIAHGSIAELVRTRVGRRRGSHSNAVVTIREVYEELIDSFDRNRPWRG